MYLPYTYNNSHMSVSLALIAGQWQVLIFNAFDCKIISSVLKTNMYCQ